MVLLVLVFLSQALVSVRRLQALEESLLIPLPLLPPLKLLLPQQMANLVPLFQSLLPSLLLAPLVLISREKILVTQKSQVQVFKSSLQFPLS